MRAFASQGRKIRRAEIFFLACLIAFGLASCSYRRERGGRASLVPMPSRQMIEHVGYNEVARIFQDHCVTCHGTSGGVNLENFAAASAASTLDRIYRSTVQEWRMPKSPAADLTLAERQALWAWVLAGGPEKPLDGSDGGPPPPPPLPLEPKYASIRSVLFEKKCLRCHSPGGKAERVPMVTLEDLLNSPLEIVVPGDADNSDLILVLDPAARKPMPPPDSGMSPVSPEDVLVIREWINKGATD